MNHSRLCTTTALSIFIAACNPYISATINNTSSSCVGILEQKDSYSNEFWLGFVKEHYPDTEKGAFMRLYRELKKHESHPTLGVIALSISEDFRRDPPEHLKPEEKNIWNIRQMQDNLAKILDTLTKVDKNTLGGVYKFCSIKSV